jgi:hypothetical protein
MVTISALSGKAAAVTAINQVAEIIFGNLVFISVL